MKLRHLFVLGCSAAFAISAHAEIYKRVDEDGPVTYSSTPIKGGKKLHLEPLPTMAAPPKENKAAEGFPRVHSDTQSGRDDTRRRILEDELATEQKALEEARVKLQEVKDNPETFKGPAGQGPTPTAPCDTPPGTHDRPTAPGVCPWLVLVVLWGSNRSIFLVSRMM